METWQEKAELICEKREGAKVQKNCEIIKIRDGHLVTMW